LTKLILDEQHSIANHTFNHKVLTKLSFDEGMEEINTFNSLIKTEHNYKINYFRPPHGKINLNSKKLIRNSGLKCVMWNLLTYDYHNDFDKVKYSVDNYLKKDSIIVLHDSDKSKDIIADSIRYIYDTAAKNGFQFGEPEECLN
jgi:peptidoglycan/xylan/chitin deacetylase (PgdA/CDA1 family)